MGKSIEMRSPIQTKYTIRTRSGDLEKIEIGFLEQVGHGRERERRRKGGGRGRGGVLTFLLEGILT